MMLLTAAMIAGGWGGASSQDDSSSGASPAVGQPVHLASHQVEAAHLDQLNAWIAEQDRVRPPAPTDGNPTNFSEGRCIAVGGGTYNCSYSYFDGGRKQEVTANLVRDGNGVWRIR